MSRRGRKRKPGPRTKADRPSRAGPAASPFNETLMDKRATLFRGDPRQALCTEAPLDVLLARHDVSLRQHRAGWTYAVLVWLRAGRPFARSQMAMLHEADGRAADWTPPSEEDAANRYTTAMLALHHAGYGATSAVNAIAVHHEGSDQSLKTLAHGLDALARHFDEEAKRERELRAANDRFGVAIR